MTTAQLPRVFRYNSVELEDPGAQHDPVDVRNLYSATYPEIVSAAIEGPDVKDGKRVYTFRKAVGTKGAGEKSGFSGTGAELIAAERARQITGEGYDTAHDDAHDDCSLVLAACAYAAPVPLYRRTREIHQGGQRYADCWPESWDRGHDKRKWLSDRPSPHAGYTTVIRIRMLAKAGALIAAEIDRLTRSG